MSNKIYRITWGGSYDTEAETEEEAKQQFIDYIQNEELDNYGRDWYDLIEIEKLF